MRRLSARLVAAAILVAATGVSAPAPPASAATCPSASGVSVVVDFGALGGGVQTTCDAGGASKNAAAMLGSAGYALSYVQRFPGFICRINGVPADDPCVNTPPADAYWGLFWSDGKSGEWVYASIAAGGLRVPAGGYVGLAWQQSADRRVPGVPATVRAAPSSTPTPTPTPTKKPPSRPTPTPSKSPTPTPTSSPSARPTTTPSATPSKPPTKKPSKKPAPSAAPSSSASASAAPSSAGPSPTESPSEVSAPTDSGEGDDSPAAAAVPTWLVLAVLAALLVGGAAAIVVRRRRSPR